MSTGSDEHLAHQLAMNQVSWQTLQEHGVTERSELELDFFYLAPGEHQARALAAFLQSETDYAVRLTSRASGFLKKKAWFVEGTTRPTKASQDTLDQWVTWMVGAGFEHGCAFDGWGAEVAGDAEATSG